MLLLYWLNIVLYFIIPLLLPVYVTRYFKISWLNPVVILLLVTQPVLLVTTLSGPFVFLAECSQYLRRT